MFNFFKKYIAVIPHWERSVVRTTSPRILTAVAQQIDNPRCPVEIRTNELCRTLQMSYANSPLRLKYVDEM